MGEPHSNKSFHKLRITVDKQRLSSNVTHSSCNPSVQDELARWTRTLLQIYQHPGKFHFRLTHALLAVIKQICTPYMATDNDNSIKPDSMVKYKRALQALEEALPDIQAHAVFLPHNWKITGNSSTIEEHKLLYVLWTPVDSIIIQIDKTKIVCEVLS